MTSALLSPASGSSSSSSSLTQLLSFGTPSGLPPSGAYLLHTTTPPTPSDLYASHLAARFLAQTSTGRVLWLNCKARPTAHLAALVKRASSGAKAVARLQIIDAAHFLLSSSSTSQADTVVEAAVPLRKLILHIQACLAEGALTLNGSGAGGEEASCLVILDDLSSLVWTLTPPRAAAAQAKPRHVVLSHGKRARTQVAPVDAWAEELGKCVEELRRVCDEHNAALLTHLQVQSTCITSRSTPIARSQGAGQGFDADDAGEEDDDSSEDDEPLPGTSEDTEILEQDEEGELIRNRNGGVGAGGDGEAEAMAQQRLDEFDDGVFRSCLAHADVWIEQRGLKSGQAADCHGEICIHPLARPSAAAQVIIPRLPLPGTHDPFRTHRRAFKSAHPDFSSRSAASSSNSAAKPSVPLLGRALASASLREREAQTSTVFRVDTCAKGREKAMLFEVRELPARAEVQTWRRAAREG